MKSLFPIGILSVVLALPATAVVQDNAAPPVPQKGAAPPRQHETPQQSAVCGADTASFGTEPGAASESKSSHTSRYYANH